MATAAMHRLISHGLGEHKSHDNADAKPNAQPESNEVDMADREDEKQFIANWEEEKRPLKPEEIEQDPEHKRLGHSSSSLRVEDFNLVKTLGTGMDTHVWARHYGRLRSRRQGLIWCTRHIRSSLACATG